LDRHVPQPPPHAADGETDHLAASVLRSLGRSYRDQFSLSAGQASVGGLLTFGLLPLWRLGARFRGYTVFERQQFWHVAEWLRTRRGGEEAMALHDAARRLRPNAFLDFLRILGPLAFNAAAFAEVGGHFSLGRIIGETYKVDWLDDGLDHPVWLAWVIGLGFAYALHALQVMLHHRRLARVVERFNAVATKEGAAPIALPELDLGIRAGWIIGPALLVWLGGSLWAIPMAIAGAAQRRYINRTATRVRGEMLDRMRTMIAQQRPPVAVPSYVIHGRRCDNPRCQAPLKAGARYCSRCGLAVAGASAPSMSEVA
jgi:hypothetical protein